MIYIIAILVLLFVILTFKVVSQAKRVFKKNRSSDEPDYEPDYLGAPDSANNFNAKALWWFWVLAFIGTAISSYIYYDAMDIEIASEHGRKIDFWFWLTNWLLIFVFVALNTAIFGFSYKYRHNKNRRATFYSHNNTLEAVWTIIPATGMTLLVLSGLLIWNDIMGDAPEDAEIIEITGRQFAWMVRYSGEDGEFGRSNYKLIDDGAGNPLGIDFADENAFDDFFNPTELNVPKGRPILLRIRARDVLHSVYIPHMRIKMDAVPGMPTKFWFTADVTTDEMRAQTGNPNFEYEIACAEICGKSHFGMRMILKVVEPEEYDRWKRDQKPILTLNPDLLAKVPENLKAKAMKYIEEPPVAEEVKTEAAEEAEDNGANELAEAK